MKYLFLILLVLFSSCSLLLSDPEILVETEELIVDVTKDILK